MLPPTGRRGAGGEMASAGSLRAIAGLLLTGAVLALGAARIARRADRRRDAVAEVASQTAADVTSALAGLGGRVGKRAARAGQERRLRWALDNDVDEVTLNDLLATEDWWQPYRDGPTLV